MAVYYVVCDDDCRYEGMTKEQILTAIEQAISQGHVSDPDSAVFSKIKEIRANEAVQFWKGTEAEFNALSPAPSVGKAVVRVGTDGVLYICTDDTTFELLNEIAENGLPIELGGTKAKTAKEARNNLDVPSNAEMHQRDRVANLLDNSDFTNPVNQRGKTSYATGNKSYTIDRWQIAQWSSGSVSLTTVSVEQNAIRVSGGVDGLGNSCAIEQNLDATKLRGKTLTLAVKTKDLSMKDAIGALFVQADGTFVLSSRLYANGVAVKHFVVPSSAEQLKVIIGQHSSQGGSGIFDASFEWAALYEGEYTADTLPTYQPKGYAHELAECQRYYENSWYGGDRSRVNQMAGIVANTAIDAHVFFKQGKRIVPTITLYPEINAHNYTKWTYYNTAYKEPDTQSVIMRNGNIGFMVRLEPKSGDSTSGHVYPVNGHWEASADL